MGRSSTFGRVAFAAVVAGCTPHDESHATKPVESTPDPKPFSATPTTTASTTARTEPATPPEPVTTPRYRPPSANACALVSADDVKAAVGFVGPRKLATTSDDREACTWEESGKSAIIVKLISPEAYDEGKQLTTARKKPQALAGVGEAAFYTAISSKSLQGGVVILRQGNAAASVQVLRCT